MQNENKDNNFGEKINDFVQRNRKKIFLFAGVIFITLAGLIVFLSLQDVFQKKAIAEVEELNTRFEELRFYIREEYFAADIEALLEDLNAFVKNKKGFAGSRAWSIIAQIHSAREEWRQAEEAWLNAANAGNKTYLAPVALFNAAVAAEEQGKLEAAIELLQKSITHPFEFPAAPRAQFSIGRLYEKLNNYPAAIDAYRAVMINWPELPVWNNLARSAIIAIEVK